MGFIDTVRRARDLLQAEGRISLRALKRELDLDAEALEELADELAEVQQIAAREGEILSWIGSPRAGRSVVPSEQEPSSSTAIAEPERRQLTVLFCDLVGSTRLASELDPEDWRKVLRRYHARVAEIVERFDGHVAQLLGDGLLVYFGWPRAHEDDAERAVRAGLALADALRTSGPADESDPAGSLSVRVGVHTGPVVVGGTGDGRSRSTLALGGAVHVASRLQSVADPDTVVISSTTLRLVSGVFVTSEMGARSLKGLEQPVVAHRVLRAAGVRSRLDLGSRRLTRAVGRDHELSILLEVWEQAAEGEGSAVLVTGEAGLGKSRLVRMLRERLAEQPHTWLECRSSPFTRASAFAPFGSLLEQELGFGPDAPPEARWTKLEHELLSAGLGAREAAPLAELLRLPSGRLELASRSSPELRRRETLEALTSWIVALTRLQPTVLFVEDLQWIDPSSRELLGHLMERAPAASLLLVLTSRPGVELPWAGLEHVLTMSLRHLRPRQARAVVRDVDAERALADQSVELIVERANGIPLHLEELTKAAVEARSLDPAAIPATLQDSLTARLDELGEAKRIAQVASVLGRSFDLDLLAAIAKRSASELEGSLVRLVDAGILFARGSPPEGSCTFKHALIEEAAYESLLKSARKVLHERVAEALEQRFPERAAESPELLAHHLERAGRVREAIGEYERAAEFARTRSAYEEAVAHSERAVHLAGGLPESARRERELELLLRLGADSSVAFSDADERLGRIWSRARELGEATGDCASLFRAIHGLSSFHAGRSELARSIELAEAAIELANEVGDDRLRFQAYSNVAVPTFYAGRFRESVEAAKRSIDLWRELGEAVSGPIAGVDQLASAGQSLAWGSFLLGRADRARRAARELVEHSRELGHPVSQTFSLLVVAIFHALLRDWKACEGLAAESRALANRYGFSYFQGGAGLAHALARASLHGEDTIGEAARALSRYAEPGNRVGTPLALWGLAQIHRASGRADEAMGLLEVALQEAAQLEQPFFDSELHRMRAELLLGRPGREEEAQRELETALDTARSQHALTFELRAATLRARRGREQGRDREARSLLRGVYERFREGFDTPDLQDAKALLEDPA